MVRDGILSAARLAIATAVTALSLAGVAVAQVVPELVTLEGVFETDFGAAVALQGDLLLVGAPDRVQPWGGLAGAVFPFRRDGAGNWVSSGLEWAPLDGGQGDHFGNDLDLDGDLAIVGAWRADGTTLTNGPGAAYVFENVGGQPPLWQELAKLEPASPSIPAWFGLHTALSGEIALAAAPREQGGAFYAYERNLGGAGAFGESYHTWLPPGDVDLGCDVEIEGGWAFVSICRPLYQFPPPAVQGEVLVLLRTGIGSWTIYDALLPPVLEPDESFGASMAAMRLTFPQTETWLAIGAPSFDPTQNGSVYVFRKSIAGPDWVFVTRIVPPEPPGTDSSFGYSLAFDNRDLIVGAGRLSGSHDPRETGSAWIYRRTGFQFEAVARFAPSIGIADNSAGRSVALSGGWLAVGGEDRAHLLRLPVFADGFESGSAIRWSSAVF